MVVLIDDFEAVYHYIANDASLFYVRTNRDAPRNQIVRIDVEKEVNKLAYPCPELRT